MDKKDVLSIEDIRAKHSQVMNNVRIITEWWHDNVEYIGDEIGEYILLQFDTQNSSASLIIEKTPTTAGRYKMYGIGFYEKEDTFSGEEYEDAGIYDHVVFMESFDSALTARMELIMYGLQEIEDKIESSVNLSKIVSRANTLDLFVKSIDSMNFIKGSKSDT